MAVPAQDPAPHALRLSDKAIWAIAGPAILANSAAPLVGLVDTAIIGHLPSPTHLAAVGVGTSFFNFIFWAFGFLRMVTTGLVAQAAGAHDETRLAREVVRAAIIGVVIGGLLVMAQAPLMAAGLALLSPPDDVAPLAEGYMTIRIWSAPMTLGSYALMGVLIGLGRTDRVLLLQLVLNGVNLALNLVFVLGLNMGVAGLALGSLIAESLTALLALRAVTAFIAPAMLRHTLRAARTWHLEALMRLLATNGFLFLRTLMLIAAFSLFTRTAGQMGTVALAAAQVVNVFMLLIALGLDAVAYAAEAYSGRAVGAQDKAFFHKVARRTFFWAFSLAGLYSIVFWLGGDALVAQLTNLESVRSALAGLMPLLTLAPLIGVASYQFDGIYIGATAVRPMAGTMAVSLAVYLLSLDWMTANFGLKGLLGALLLYLAVRGISQFIWYPRVAKSAFGR